MVKTGDFRSEVEPDVLEVETFVLRAVRRLVPNARLKRIGPIEFSPPSWSCWIIVETDAERDLLLNNGPLEDFLSKFSTRENAFPPDSFTFQSEETVARDFEGSWFFAIR